MRMLFVLLVATAVVPSCGEPDRTAPDGIAGSYVMGDVEKARKKATEPDVEDPDAPKTLGELIERSEAGETFTFSGSVDILLVLHEDGTFEYFGPLKMGDDEDLVQGRWDHDGTSVRLHLDRPRPSKDETVSVLVCPYRPGVIEYPLGRDPKNPVYYRLLDVRRLDGLSPGDGGVRIGGGGGTAGD